MCNACSLAALAVLLAVLIVHLRVEVEMAGHDPYCYWDASFLSRSFDVYEQYISKQLLWALGFSRTRPTDISSLSCWVGPVGSPHLSVQKA